jgi:hypothetical protein
LGGDRCTVGVDPLHLGLLPSTLPHVVSRRSSWLVLGLVAHLKTLWEPFCTSSWPIRFSGSAVRLTCEPALDLFQPWWAQIYAGERTGGFRLGGDQLLVDANGRSRISFEDAAVALIDEAELPRHVQRRFTIGY